MATEPEVAKDGVKLERLTHTKKFERLVAAGDLYALPVTAVPGCGYMLGSLLKKDGIQRASELYELFKKKKLKEFAKFLTCKVGAWNAVYVSTVVRALEDWEKAHVVKKEEKVKPPVEQKPKVPHKVGAGSKKWEAFMQRADLKKTSVQRVPGVGGLLGCELKKKGYTTARQLMDQYKGDDAAFHKWVLCCFGYWNSLYSKTVLEALKAYGAAHEETFLQKVARAGENAAEVVSDALDKDVAKEEENANEDDPVKQEAPDDSLEQVEENANEDAGEDSLEQGASDESLEQGALDESLEQEAADAAVEENANDNAGDSLEQGVSDESLEQEASDAAAESNGDSNENFADMITRVAESAAEVVYDGLRAKKDDDSDGESSS